MEKVNFVKNNVLRLPPGFRFHPTDEELVVQYLRRKVNSLPMHVHIIPEVDVCKSDPWDLPGDVENEIFFFSTREVKYPTGNRSNRATLSGCWKAQGLDKEIVSRSNKMNDNNCDNNNKQVVGMKKTLVFYKGKSLNGTKTNWVMHEYRLAGQIVQTTQGVENNWVLCRIFLKKEGTKKDEEKDAKETTEVENVDKSVEMMNPKRTPVFYDFLPAMSARKEKTDELSLAATYSSSGSSGATNAACGDFLGKHEDETK